MASTENKFNQGQLSMKWDDLLGGKHGSEKKNGDKDLLQRLQKLATKLGYPVDWMYWFFGMNDASFRNRSSDNGSRFNNANQDKPTHKHLEFRLEFRRQISNENWYLNYSFTMTFVRIEIYFTPEQH